MKLIKNIFKNEYVSPLRATNAFETKKLTLVALLAAVYALGSFLPGFPMIGVSGSNIDIARSLEMVYGLVLGPVLGPLTAFTGAVVGKTLTGGGFGMFFTPLAPISAFMAAALSRPQAFKVKGWVLASAVLGVLILGWYGIGTGLVVPYYPVFHLIAFGIIILFRDKLVSYTRSEDKGRLTMGVALCSFPSTMAGHMLGNLIFIVLLSPEPLFFMSILPVSIAERLALTALATFISVPLLIVVRRLYPELLN